MAADLSAYGLFHRRELVLDEDALLELENGFGSDRLRRVLFDRIQTVSAWTQILVGRLVFSLILMLLGLYLLFPLFTNGNMDLVPLGVVFLAIGLIILLRYAIIHRYNLVVRLFDGTEFRIVAMGRPGKFRKFVKRLVDGIAACQEKEEDRRMMRSSTGTIREAAEPLGS